MGCDIHPFFEVKTSRGWEFGGKWERKDGLVEAPLIPAYSRRDRCYAAFGVLAGVRSDNKLPLISPPRGLPNDLSLTLVTASAVDDIWFGDHSHSWVTLEEVEGMRKRLRAMWGKEYPPKDEEDGPHHSAFRFLDDWESEAWNMQRNYKECRWVFGFDS